MKHQDWFEKESNRMNREFRKAQRSVFAFGVFALVVNVVFLCAAGYGGFWGYQHVIAPSFDLPTLRVE